MRGIGVPVKLLSEAQGHICTMELYDGSSVRGTLLEVHDNWNLQIAYALQATRNGQFSPLSRAFIRGSHIRFVVVPDILRHAPMFRNRNKKGRGVALARGRATVVRAERLREGDSKKISRVCERFRQTFWNQ